MVRSRNSFGPYADFEDEPVDLDEAPVRLDLQPDDRIGRPTRRRRGRIVALLGVLAGLGYAGAHLAAVPIDLAGTWATVRSAAEAVIAALTPPTPSATPSSPTVATAATQERSATPSAAPVEQAAAEAPTQSASSPPTTTVTATKESAPSEPSAPAPPLVTAALPPAATTYATPPPSDAFGTVPVAISKRATAAGLHPDLSPAVLTRLTETDFRNATQAIEKAIAETPDDGMLAWPRQRPGGAALFHVYFVPGAARNDCRRYVVTITKDGWLTTALPMERCGVVRRAAKSGG